MCKVRGGQSINVGSVFLQTLLSICDKNNKSSHSHIIISLLINKSFGFFGRLAAAMSSSCMYVG